MRLLSRSTAVAATAGSILLITAVAACALLGSGAGTGAGPAGSGRGGSTAATGSDGSMPSWLSDLASSLDSGGPGESGLAARSGSSGSPGGTQTTAMPSARSSSGASASAAASATATLLPRTPTPPPTANGPCYVFPSSNVWNQDVTGLSVASNSAAMINAIGASNYLHPDFDAIGDGIPYNLVNSSTPQYNVSFDYADESDPGPYPIPSGAAIEGGSDRHLITLDLAQCKLWELYDVRQSGSSWSAGSGAIFDLKSNDLRPAGWTSADAAGLPIFPGLVRYAEVNTGSIDHAIRFTAPDTCGYIYPARHQTAAPCSNLPPMGLRLRLKASVNISSFGPHAQIVLTALKRYGMILADNGSPWYISGVPDSRWNDDEMHALQNLHGSDFEVVDTSGLRNG